MCPQRVCTTCGKPSTRIVEHEQLDTGRTTNGPKPGTSAAALFETRTEASVTTIGWSDCGHDSWRTGLVLDPFAGSGTTLEAAQIVGRHAIGIDIDARNAVLAEARLGMFATIETLNT